MATNTERTANLVKWAKEMGDEIVAKHGEHNVALVEAAEKLQSSLDDPDLRGDAIEELRKHLKAARGRAMGAAIKTRDVFQKQQDSIDALDEVAATEW